MDAAVRKPNPIDVAVGARIRSGRKFLGMSQSSLADAIGVTFQQVQKYEKGANRVGASRLQAVAAVLRVPVSFFFEKSEELDSDLSPEEDEVTSFLRTSDGIALNRAFGRIEDGKVKRKIVALVRALAGVDAI